MKQYFVITKQNRQRIAQAVIAAPEGHAVKISEPNRTLEQNSKMWPMLADISKQVLWDGERMTDEEWKDWFTAALKKQRMVRGMEGGIVFVGSSTSRKSKKEFSDLIELMYAFGASQTPPVIWSDEPVKEAA